MNLLDQTRFHKNSNWKKKLKLTFINYQNHTLGWMREKKDLLMEYKISIFENIWEISWSEIIGFWTDAAASRGSLNF